MYISTNEELDAFCTRAGAHEMIAVDTEFLRERTFYPRLCLVQVATPDECALIDPLTVGDLAPLTALMGDSSTLKVFHACSQDMEALSHALGTVPAPIFDTQVAAAFLGERLQVSYNGLVHTFCGVSLPKTESLTDWSRRPLTPEQLEYALDDVRYLIQVYEVMRERLEAQGRMAWVVSEMRPYQDASQYQIDPRSAYKRVKRVSSCTRRQLAVARELAAWRERQAERNDIPRKWVMSDEVLLALCKRAPASVEDFRRVRGTEQLSERDVDAALAAIARGRRCPKENLPAAGGKQHHAAQDSELESVVDLMYALIRLVSERSGVASGMIASRDDLADYIDHPERSRLRDGWRFELVGSLIDDLLAGEIGLTVKGHAVELV